MDLNLLVVLIGTMTVTSYRPVQSQTDNTPTITSIGDLTTKFGVAVSQDLLASGEVQYGDVLHIDGLGLRVVNDCMNKRHKRSADLLVLTHKEEKRIGTRHLKVWRIREKQRAK
jgi:hypothetical protein